MADGAAGALLLSGLISSAGQLFSDHQNRKANKSRWSQSVALSNTAHQREVADLEAAGLNPILSADGSGASVPSLGAYESQNPGEGLSDGLSSASKYLSEEYKQNVAALKLGNRQTRLENSAAKVRNDILDNERVLSDFQTKSQLDEATNSHIEQAARHEALTGVRTLSRDYFKNGRYSQQYRQLVETFRRQIRLGEYESHIGHSILRDAKNVGELIGSGVQSARGYKDLKRAGKRVRKGYKKKGQWYEEETNY